MNILNRVYYKPELTQTIERLENNLDSVNESLLDELQAKIYLLMKQKYFIGFKNYIELHKILLKNDFIFKYTNNMPSSPQTSSSSQLVTNKTITNPIILADQQQQHAKQNMSSSENEVSFNLDEDLVASLTNSLEAGKKRRGIDFYHKHLKS